MARKGVKVYKDCEKFISHNKKECIASTVRLDTELAVMTLCNDS
jgi:hypothetical protein